MLKTRQAAFEGLAYHPMTCGEKRPSWGTLQASALNKIEIGGGKLAFYGQQENKVRELNVLHVLNI